MALIVVSALTLSLSPLQISDAPSLALCFIGAQSLLAYFSAGIAKLWSRKWRSGSAVQGILATESHGSRAASAILRQNPGLGMAACWSTIALEIAMPVWAFFSPEGAVGLIITGCAFHICCALFMGLNTFPLAFASTYPGVFYLASVRLSSLPS